MARSRRGPLRVVWSESAADDLRRPSARAPAQARAVYYTVRWLRRVAAVGEIGTVDPVRPGERYRPVPPQGVFFIIDRDRQLLHITAIQDARSRRHPWY